MRQSKRYILKVGRLGPILDDSNKEYRGIAKQLFIWLLFQLGPLSRGHFAGTEQGPCALAVFAARLVARSCKTCAAVIALFRRGAGRRRAVPLNRSRGF